MIVEPKQADIDAAFAGTNFGTAGDTADGRRDLVAHCVLKRACGFRDGHTIETICKELKLLTKAGAPRKQAKFWVYFYFTSPGLLTQTSGEQPVSVTDQLLPCPICQSVESCDHTFKERMRADEQRLADHIEGGK